MYYSYTSTIIAIVLALATPSFAIAQTAPMDAFRLENAVNAPDWLTIRGEVRARYETLDGQFRARGSGSDQALALRTLILAEANLKAINLPGVTFGGEVQDARLELDDAGTPLSTSNVNAFDMLQA